MTGGMAKTMTGRAAALGLLAALAGCGSASVDGPGLGASLGAAARQVVARGTGAGGAPAPADTRTPEQRAAEALAINPGPLVMAGFEQLNRTEVLAMTDDNRGMRTYMTKGSEALVLRGGMLVATRGLGNDLSNAEAGTESLIRAQRAGEASRLMRYLEGDGREHTIALRCTVAPTGGGRVTESCAAGALRIENNYLVGGGTISVSRQWIGPKLGYVTIQTLRP